MTGRLRKAFLVVLGASLASTDGLQLGAGRLGRRQVHKAPSMSAKLDLPARAASLGAACALSLALGLDPVSAVDSQRVGEIPASGFIFKDTLDVTAFADPKVEGVALYVSDFSKPITERLGGDFFSDPSTASITCAATGTVKLSEKVDMSKAGEEVFSEARSLLFKSVKVRRIIDTSNKNVIYVSYSQKLVSNDDNNKSRFKSSLCAVHYDE